MLIIKGSNNNNTFLQLYKAEKFSYLSKVYDAGWNGLLFFR